MTATKSVLIIGVGNMGGAMAERLVEAGWQVAVSDLDDAKVADLIRKGAIAHEEWASDATENIAPRRLIVCVVDAAQTQEVLFGDGGFAQTLPRDSIVLLCPTIAPGDVERFAAGLQVRGIHAIDAPMSGGPARARDGSMSLMVAASDIAFSRGEPLLAALSDHVIRIGTRPGDGARTKLVNNLLAAINLVGAAEAIALAERLGLDARRTLAVIESSSGQSWIGSDRMHRALAGDRAPRAHLALLAKDSRLAMEMLRAEGLDARMGSVAAQVFADAVAAGGAPRDDSALLEWLRGRSFSS